MNDMPVDTHELLGLIAPRPLYLATASEDLHSDPRGEFEAAIAAGPIYKLLGARPLEVLDHREQNTFETIEHYQIQQFWALSDDKKNYECNFYPQTIRDLFAEPNTTLRSMPLGMTYPCQSILITKVIMPEEWPVDNETNHFQCAGAELDANRTVDKNTFVMTYEYRTLSNFVSAAAMPDYVGTLDQMKNALGYSLTWAN